MSHAGLQPRALGHAFRQLREAAGLTQEQVATRAGVSYGYVSRFEAGHYARPSYAVLCGLASSVGMAGADALIERLHEAGRQVMHGSAATTDRLGQDGPVQLPAVQVAVLGERAASG